VSQSSLAIFPPDTTRTPLLIRSSFIIQYVEIYSHITGSLQRKCPCISVHLYRIPPLAYQPLPYIYTCPPKILAILEHSRLQRKLGTVLVVWPRPVPARRLQQQEGSYVIRPRLRAPSSRRVKFMTMPHVLDARP
jgi:hypothetical protein